jgi:two-component system CheB/CheR fusion protein
VTELSRANSDMNNLLAGTGVATLFVDHQLRIVRFTPTATELINLIPTDLGRPVAHIVSNLAGHDGLVENVQLVLADLVPREVEVQTKGGAWFLMRTRPYRTLGNVIEGAVITFTDISESKSAGRRLQERERELSAILQGMFNAFAIFESVFDGEGQFISYRFVRINQAYESLMGVSSEQVSGKTVHELWPGTEETWVEACGRVVLSGQSHRFELHHAPTGKDYRCNVFRPGESQSRFCMVIEELVQHVL